MLEQAERGGPNGVSSTPLATRRRISSILRRGSLDPLDLGFPNLAELFPASSDGQ